jgi:hypothetical protein
MGKWLRTWVKKGKWDIYEGQLGMAVGENDEYSVYASKDNLQGTSRIRFNDNGIYAKERDNVYIGEYSKKVASALIDRIDSVIAEGKLPYI